MSSRLIHCEGCGTVLAEQTGGGLFIQKRRKRRSISLVLLAVDCDHCDAGWSNPDFPVSDDVARIVDVAAAAAGETIRERAAVNALRRERKKATA